MNFARESFAQVREELPPLLAAHYREIALYPDIPLDPDWTKYETLDRNGFLRIFTVRQTDALVGYAVFFVLPSPHYKGSLQAGEDVLYLDPSLRGHFVGAKFIKFCDDELRKDGVQVVRHHTKAKHSFAPLLERLGYELEDFIYAKRLDRYELKVDTMKLEKQL